MQLIFYHNQGGCQHIQTQAHPIQIDLKQYCHRRDRPPRKPLNFGQRKHLPHRNKAVSSFVVFHHTGTDITRVICTSKGHRFHTKHKTNLNLLLGLSYYISGNCSLKTDQNSNILTTCFPITLQKCS